MAYIKGSSDQIRGKLIESEFEQFCKAHNVKCVKSTIKEDKVYHVDYWINDSIGVDVKNNKWYKSDNGCVELKVNSKSVDTYIKNAYNTPVSGAIWCSSWSEAHTKNTEWLVFKMNDGFKVIDRTNNNFVKLIMKLANKYRNEHPTHKFVAYKERYNANKPYTLFGNQNDTKAVWLMPIPLKDIEPYMIPLEEALKKG